MGVLLLVSHFGLTYVGKIICVVVFFIECVVKKGIASGQKYLRFLSTLSREEIGFLLPCVVDSMGYNMYILMQTNDVEMKFR